MQVNIDTPSALRRKLTIEVEPDEIKRELDSAYNELKRGVVLKGFRPGHAPRLMLERFFGDQVRGEVLQKLVQRIHRKSARRKRAQAGSRSGDRHRRDRPRQVAQVQRDF